VLRVKVRVADFGRWRGDRLAEPRQDDAGMAAMHTRRRAA